MKIPRDLSGRGLIKKLGKLGYKSTRQVGSHIRLTTQKDGIHHITIPNHKQIRVGTLSSILKDVAAHFNITKEELVERIF